MAKLVNQAIESARNIWPKINKALLGAAVVALAGLFVLSGLFSHAMKAPRAPEVKYTPEQLISDLPARLAYLRNKVPGVGFYIYKIRSRDNLWKLAVKKRYTVHSLIGNNPQLETYEVDTGQQIIIPSRAGTLHVVQPWDTWKKIADRYKTSVFELEKYNPGAGLSRGDMVFVPDRRPDMELMNDKMREKYELRALFVSPLGGRLTSTFGMRWHPVTGTRSMHGGIDIAVREGTWVGAAADGVVTVATHDAGHYGTAVYIDHQDGYVTHYGHLSKIYVRVGQRVKARQLIAKSGSTGRSTGPHLHFTIQKNGVNRDPLKFIW